MNVDIYIFLKICRDFFRIFWAFYVAFCAYRLIPIRVAEIDPSQCPLSRRPRPRLWTMAPTVGLWLSTSSTGSSFSLISPRTAYSHVSTETPICIFRGGKSWWGDFSRFKLTTSARSFDIALEGRSIGTCGSSVWTLLGELVKSLWVRFILNYVSI